MESLVSLYHYVLSQPSAPSGLLIATVAIVIFSLALCGGTMAASPGNSTTFLQRILRLVICAGRTRNLLCSPCDRCRKRYPVANTCQIPFFKSLSDIYNFVFGYTTTGLFVEIGAYDGETFSNTSCLADIGWQGHYVEPIPQYANVCRQRHAGNPNVTVHTLCVGERDDELVELSSAGPFSSSVEDEIAASSEQNAAQLNTMLSAIGWSHGAKSERVQCRTQSLNSFFSRMSFLPRQVDVLVIDTEGCEWPILRGFDMSRWRPKLVIIEMQEKLKRYQGNLRVASDSTAIETYLREAGYSILYRDVVNTVFMHREVRPHGEE